MKNPFRGWWRSASQDPQYSWGDIFARLETSARAVGGEVAVRDTWRAIFTDCEALWDTDGPWEATELARDWIGQQIQDNDYALRVYAQTTRDPVQFLWLYAREGVLERGQVKALAKKLDTAAVAALAAEYPDLVAELDAGGERRFTVEHRIWAWALPSRDTPLE